MNEPEGIKSLSNKPSPTVRSVVEAVSAQIRTGGLKVGLPLPSEIELARKFDVSRGTVRRAIDALVAEGTLSRLPHARPIVTGPRGTTDPAGTDIQVWISRKIADFAAMHFLKGVSQTLGGAGRRLIVREPTRFTGEIVECEERQFLLDFLHDDNAPGAIIERDPFRSNADLMQRILDRGKHVVFVDSPPPAGIAADHVGTANTSAARLLTQHLIELGHTRIVCAIDTEIPQPIRDRVKGYRRAMRNANLEAQGAVIVGDKCPRVVRHRSPRPSGRFLQNLSPSPGYTLMGQAIADAILAMSPRPTAVFVAYDVLAFWVSAYLEGAGLSIPDDISVVGFDWRARPGEALADILTTAGQDFEGFGRHSVDLLLDRLSDGVQGAPRHVLLDAPVLVRSSTAARHVSPVPDPAPTVPINQP